MLEKAIVANGTNSDVASGAAIGAVAGPGQIVGPAIGKIAGKGKNSAGDIYRSSVGMGSKSSSNVKESCWRNG